MSSLAGITLAVHTSGAFSMSCLAGITLVVHTSGAFSMSCLAESHWLYIHQVHMKCPSLLESHCFYSIIFTNIVSYVIVSSTSSHSETFCNISSLLMRSDLITGACESNRSAPSLSYSPE
ncbi:hypothetical protein BsWGS_13755 [Bradybaena similaris]